MFDIKDYLQRMENIRRRELITKSELCKEIGIAWNTLARVLKMEEGYPNRFRTLKKIKEFVDSRENK